MPCTRSIVFTFLTLCHLSLVAPNLAHCQVIDDVGVWTAVFAQGDLRTDPSSTDWKWWYDSHLRFFDDSEGFGQSIIRPGIGYQLGESVTVWAGYGWIHTSPGPAPSFDEHRIWQQVTWSEKCSLASLGFRSRLEQRFVETGSEAGWRFRQLVAARRPFPLMENVTLVVWDEIFFQLNDTDWGASGGLDQNRAFVGLGFKWHPDSPCRVEMGYLHQFVRRSNLDDISNHLLSINLFWTPSLN